MLFTQELIQKMDLSELATLHNLLHKEDKRDKEALELHLTLHQELAKRNLKIAHSNLDLEVSTFALQNGLSKDDVESVGLPVVKQEEDGVPKRDVRLLQPLQKEDQSDGEMRVVLGIVLEPNEVDSYKHTVTTKEIETAAYKWLEYNQIRMVGHERVSNAQITIVESYIAPVDFEWNGEPVKTGSGVLGVRVHDDKIWEKITKGELTGYSMGGWASLVKIGESDNG